MDFAAQFDGRTIFNPLFWQRGVSHDAIREEMEQMKQVGIHEFVVEPRPHPDYLGEGWWNDLDFILAQAEKLDMTVWFFDDGQYPSGSAHGLLAQKYPQYTKRYWNEQHMDVTGPAPFAHFLVQDWLQPGEQLYRVIAARRTDRRRTLSSDSLIDLTDRVTVGRLYWPVPEGEWRVFVIKITPFGGEEHTQSYANPISRAAVDKYIQLIHEAHYARYGHLFGSRIAGFFTDEPRFGNAVGYDRILGKSAMPLPWAPDLDEALSACPQPDFTRYLPLLWYDDAEGRYHDIRYAYMDAVSRLFAQNFTGQLGDWCRAHGVRLIGHVVEENGCHARLGYGAGHYFRAIAGLDAAGIDVVDNMMPEQTSGIYATAFNEYDCDFNHWALAKLASSAAHADPKKQGRALCEAFGAYGWFEGLRLMKWITDRLAVEGINILTPHAFSPSEFPDPDCPPHFIARGENPQFRLFHVWSGYARRLIAPLAGGVHIAPVAVLYHAEAEWGGEAEPMEKAVKALARCQMDCDIVCADDLIKDTTRPEGSLLKVGSERFRVLVVPYAQFLPGALLNKLAALLQAGIPVWFTRALPDRAYFGGPVCLPGALVTDTEELPDALIAYRDIRCDVNCPDLQVTHYRQGEKDIYLFANQSTKQGVDTPVTFGDDRPALLYNAMDGMLYRPRQTGNRLQLKLAPWESICVVFGQQAEFAPEYPYTLPQIPVAEWRDGWRISVATAREYPTFTPTLFDTVGDMSLPDKLPRFTGTLRYERSFTVEDSRPMLLDLTDAYEAVTVTVNGLLIGEMICPPYRVMIPAGLLRTGENTLCIEVTNTVVKEEHSNDYDRYFPQDPTGLVYPVRLLK